MNLETVPSVLFVCTANIIRSPMAAAIFKQKLQRFFAFREWKVESAGVRGLSGQPADLNAQQAMELHSLDIGQHTARRINRSLIDQYDLILTMERQHQEILFSAYPEAAEKIFFIGALAGNDQDVADPILKPREAYVQTVKLLKDLLEKIFIDILLLAEYSWLKSQHAERFEPVHLDIKDVVKNLVSEDPVYAGIEGTQGFPDDFRYEIMQVLLGLYPNDERPLEVLKDLAGKVEPSAEELQWLRFIHFQVIALPITCVTTMRERKFIHPKIQAELDELSQKLTESDFEDLNKELELLYHKNYSLYKYRINIWDLSSKYKQLPHKVGDYEQAYASLKGIS